MRTIIIYGASDDLIEIDGAIRAEIPTYDEETTIRFDNGDEFVVTYDGEWHIEPPESFASRYSSAEVLPVETVTVLKDYSETCVYVAWDEPSSVEKV